MFRSLTLIIGALILALGVALTVIRPWESTTPAQAVADACQTPAPTAPTIPALPTGQVAIVLDVCAILRRHESPAGAPLPVAEADVISGPIGVVETIEFGQRRAGDGSARSSDDRLRPQGEVTFVEVAFATPIPRTGDGSRPFEITPGLVDATGVRLFTMGGSGPALGLYQADFWVERGMDMRYLTVVLAHVD